MSKLTSSRWLLLPLALAGCVVPENVVVRGDTGSGFDGTVEDVADRDTNTDHPTVDRPNADVPTVDAEDVVTVDDSADVIDTPNPPGDVPSDVPSCPMGETRCGGACTNTQTSAMNCGRCGAVCGNAGTTAVSCANGRCTLTCAAGRADCDNDPANGCEVNLNADPLHCGTCPNACPSGPNSTASCVMGACRLTCADFFGNCDDNPANGCEVDIRSTTDHCGMCGNRCAFANAGASCTNGICLPGNCMLGFGNCDGDGSNGCEANLRTDGANCGTCGTACMAGFSCNVGACQNGCNGGLFPCSGSCVDRTSDARHCGMCGNACPARANAQPTCNASACSFSCNMNFGNCDNMAANGCESDLRADENNCGVCGNSCPAPANSTRLCSAGACSFTCSNGFGNCDGNLANGCESSLATSNTHCGRCGNACGGGQSCTNGTCACPPGETFCMALNRCVNLGTDNNNCGACGVVCGAGTRCSNGTCVANCPAGQMLCGASCVTLSSDRNNCGMCGNQCAAGRVCTGGACMCPAGTTDCLGNCTNTNNDPSNCGACMRLCNPDRFCSAGNCACNGGLSDCNGMCVNYNNDNFNCGGCGTVCPVNNTCSNRLCCAPGLSNCNNTGCLDNSFNNNGCGAGCQACQAGRVCSQGSCQVPPANDRCDMATPINDTIGQVATLSVNTAGATPHLNMLNCVTGGTSAKTDVFFSFTVPANERHLVYADTFGSSFDTVLAFADSCVATGSATALTRMPANGELLCNDDANMAAGCAAVSNASILTGILEGGALGTTYYVALSGYANQTGMATLHFVRRVINDVMNPIFVPAGGGTYNTTTVGRNLDGTMCGGMAATGPELAFFWRTCADFAGNPLTASTCNPNTQFNTLLRYWSSSGGNVCNDNVGAPACNNGGGFQSILPSPISQPIGAGLHIVFLDGAQPGPDRGAATVVIAR